MSGYKDWLHEHNVEFIEILVANFAGHPCGKLLPIAEFTGQDYKLPLAVFGQTINGTYFMPADNLIDRDMVVRPDLTTLRMLSYAARPTASVIMDCFDNCGTVVALAPRALLERILALFEANGWHPIVAPEIEFYIEPVGDGDSAAKRTQEAPVDPYGVDCMHGLGQFFSTLAEHCRIQGIAISAISQELGGGQFEVNFRHGAALKLADDVCYFKRTLKQVAASFGLRATFLAKPNADKPGSSMHLHQSVYDVDGVNVFANSDGSNSKLFEYCIGGLQTFLPHALLLLAPYPNSYRRFLSHWSSPVNLEWGTDNRTVGLRVPHSPPEARRIENRLAGSDVNPYLAIAATLACGVIGMLRKASCGPARTGSAYDLPFALHRNLYEALDSLRSSGALRDTFGDDFVTLYTAVKEYECREFEMRIPAWEYRELANCL